MLKKSELEFCKETILSLDTASHTGYAVYKNGKIIESGVWDLGRKRENRDHRHTHLLDHINDMVAKYNVTILVAEDIYKDPSKPKVFEILAELRGVVKLATSINSLDFRLIDYRKVQSYLIPKFSYKRPDTEAKRAEQRELDKERMINKIKSLQYDLHTEDPNYISDEADAIAQLLYYMHLLGWLDPNPITKID